MNLKGTDTTSADNAGNLAHLRARAIAAAGGIDAALANGTLPAIVTVPLVEGVVLGLLRQGVRKYLAIFGHGNTALGEVLRVYEEAGVTRTWQFRNEVAMAHAATQLSWEYGETTAVVTSIGPGALQAFSASLAAASNNVGVYHIYGDETTHGEGYNMQQVPRPEQGAFARITSVMGRTHVLHTPQSLREALRRGSVTVRHPYKAGPFYLLMPINTQPAMVTLNLAALPTAPTIPAMQTADEGVFREAAATLARHDRVVIKVGGGGRKFGAQIARLAERVGAAVVLSPGSLGVLPDAHPLNMHVGGSKGSISGNFAMEEATLLVAIGTRAVCQSDCSGIGYPKVTGVINFNGDIDDLTHYNNTQSIHGDIGANLDRLIAALGEADAGAPKAAWLAACAAKKAEWVALKQSRVAAVAPIDDVWQRRVMTEVQAVKTAIDFADEIGAVKLFDAGDVQAVGFQVAEDQRAFQTFTETGASYMGFAASGLMAAAIADSPTYPIAFSGDGSFMMNPQILLDAVEHGLRGMLIIFDNRRMSAISSLQHAQYGAEFRTSDSVAVDYVRMASSFAGVLALAGGDTPEAFRGALEEARAYDGFSVIHVPVYGGNDPVGGLGVYGSWNVGNWVADVQDAYARTNI